MPNDHDFMQQAIDLAKCGHYTTHPNPRVGCVITRDEQIIAEGYHQRAGQPHAEINALNQLTEKGLNALGATAYVTLEPCSHFGRTPPCANALIDSGINRVVIAMQDPNPNVSGRGIQRLKEAGIEVLVGVHEAAAQALNIGFIQRMQYQRPWVRVKMAMSLDGRTAMASGESQWITGAEARQDVQYGRAASAAILSTAATVIADNASLNVRLTANDLSIMGNVRQPVRIILDQHARLSADLKLFSCAGELWLLHHEAYSDAFKEQVKQYAETTKVTYIKTPLNEQQQLDLPWILAELGRREVNSVWVEAGKGVGGALLDENLVDELIIYMAPHLMGDTAQGLFHLNDRQKMSDRIELAINNIQPVGRDWKITAYPQPKVSSSC